MSRRLADARPVDLAWEPDAVIQALADGSLEATWVTRELAIRELEQRHMLADPGCGAGPARRGGAARLGPQPVSQAPPPTFEGSS